MNSFSQSFAALAAGALLAVGGTATSASAQSAKLIFEASINGGPFLMGLQTAPVNASVTVRVRAQLQSGQTSLGLAGFQFLPTISNWHTLDGFTTFDTATVPLAGLAAGVGQNQFGRVLPFGAVNSGGPNSPTLAGSTMEIRGGFTGATNLNAQQIGQGTQNLAGVHFNNGLDVVIYRWEMTLGGATAPRDLVLSTPLASVGTLANVTRWYTSASGANVNATTGSNEIMAATIRVPTAGPLALLGLAGVVACRRRRE